MTNLSVELAKEKLLEADEVKKASAAKLKLRNKKTREIKNPMDAQKRSERFDKLTQVVQDPSFVSDVAPAKGDDNPVPQADFADTYTKTMPHGQSGGTGGNGQNQKSPKGVGTTSMTPNQTTRLKQIAGGTMKAGIQGTEDDDSQIFAIPQANYADTYTKQMPHGRAGGTTDEDKSSAEPSKRSYGKMDGGPTRKGGGRDAKLGGDVVGAKKKDSQDVQQVTGPGEESAPGDALKWKDQMGTKKDTGGASNVYEDIFTGVTVKLGDKTKATFDVVSGAVLRRMYENYAKHGVELAFEPSHKPAWKGDRKLFALVRESIDAKYNSAPNFAKAARKAAMQRFGALCYHSYNDLYEDRQKFATVLSKAYQRIEEIAEERYIKSLQFFDGLCRLVVEGDEVDMEMVTQATDKNMAARQFRNQAYEEYGFGADIKHIFVDGEKFTPRAIKEYQARALPASKK